MAWLTESEVLALKVGDEIGVTGGSYGPPTIERVTKRTATQVIIGDRRFNRSGRMLGSSTWNGSYLLAVDDAREQIAADMHRNGLARAQRALREFRWGALSLEQCQQVQALLDSFTAQAATDVSGNSQDKATAK